MKDREDQIKSLWKEGHSHAEIGRRLDPPVSRQRAHQLAKALGLHRPRQPRTPKLPKERRPPKDAGTPGRTGRRRSTPKLPKERRPPKEIRVDVVGPGNAKVLGCYIDAELKKAIEESIAREKLSNSEWLREALQAAISRMVTASKIIHRAEVTVEGSDKDLACRIDAELKSAIETSIARARLSRPQLTKSHWLREALQAAVQRSRTHIFKDMIMVVRREQARRESLLKDEDEDGADVRWRYADGPFLNQLCLMLLVTLWHQIERELVELAARVHESSTTISFKQYEETVSRLTSRRRLDWDKIRRTLNLERYEGYMFTKCLRLISNSYKHHHLMKPDESLIRLIQAEVEFNYAPLPESAVLQKRLASFIGIGIGASWCDIAERFVDISGNFLAEVKSRTKLTKVGPRIAPMHPDSFEG